MTAIRSQKSALLPTGYKLKEIADGDQSRSPTDVDDYSAALTGAGVHYTFHRNDAAGHAFKMFNNPNRYFAEASEDAWGKVLDLPNDTLGQPENPKTLQVDRASTRECRPALPPASSSS